MQLQHHLTSHCTPLTTVACLLQVVEVVEVVATNVTSVISLHPLVAASVMPTVTVYQVCERKKLLKEGSYGLQLPRVHLQTRCMPAPLQHQVLDVV